MSHLPVLVIGPNPMDQLTPHEERLNKAGNVVGHWDSAILGGRFTGSLFLKPGQEGYKGQLDRYDYTPLFENGVDSAMKGAIDWTAIPQLLPVVIVKDGEWIEWPEEATKDQWKVEVHRLLGEVPDDVLVSLYDIHQ